MKPRDEKKNTIPFAKHKKDIDQTFVRDGEECSKSNEGNGTKIKILPLEIEIEKLKRRIAHLHLSIR